MDLLAEWTSAVCAGLALDEHDLDPATPLHIARRVRRDVMPSAAPVTIYLLGVAIGRGLPVAEAVERVTKLAEKFHGIDWSD